MRKIIPIVLVFVVLGSLLLFNIWDCNRRNTTIPDSLVFPGSTLVDFIDGGTSTYRLVTKRFITTASRDDVLEFYQNNGAMCSSHCSGTANPSYANYTVLIPNKSYSAQNQTKYTIEIRWRGCTNELN